MSKIIKEKIRNKLLTEYFKRFSDKAFVEESNLREVIDKILKDISLRENLHFSEEEQKDIIREIIEEV
ncbi:MAG: hypothetical protein NC936_06055, partial [Candidatus Omnitrophica bacterium]|nr:hypothetical protein [Candidatus Omnitrophota bacterium]